MEPKFQIEFRYPRVGEQLPALIIYQVDESKPLAVPTEVYRSENYGQSIIVENKGVALPDLAWSDATYSSAGGFTDLADQIRRIFKPTAVNSAGFMDEVVTGVVNEVKQHVLSDPGQYL